MCRPYILVQKLAVSDEGAGHGPGSSPIASATVEVRSERVGIRVGRRSSLIVRGVDDQGRLSQVGTVIVVDDCLVIHALATPGAPRCEVIKRCLIEARP